MDRAARVGKGPGAPRVPPVPRRLSRGAWCGPAQIAALFVVVPYLAVSLWFHGRHLLGDSQSHPLAYFFTWDMFPNYGTHSVRRTVLGVTEDGRAVQLVPGPGQRFRWGRSHDLARTDLLGTIDIEPGAGWMRRAALASLGPVDADAGPRTGPDRIAAREIATLLVLEESWPARFNLPPDLYERAYAEPRPDRRAVRIAAEFPNPRHVPRAAGEAVDGAARDDGGAPGDAPPRLPDARGERSDPGERDAGDRTP